MSDTDATSTRRPSAYQHPGFEWLSAASCAGADASPAAESSDGDGSSKFFVDAGRVISDDVLRMCQGCPVRRECIVHSYLGGPNETLIGAGYFGGFSLGQRKGMTLKEALARAELDSAAPRQGTLL